jgi:solute carrier family 35 protein E1
MAGAPDSVALGFFFVFWYVGNIYYNEYNKMALDAVGGKKGGLTMTVSTMQLGVCSLYALILWIISINPIKLCGFQLPEKMKVPSLTKADMMKTLPVGCCSAAAHSAGVFCLGADPLFGQIVKAGEPVLSALVNGIFYGKKESLAKLVCLVFIVGGVAFASLKKGPDGSYGLKFDETALIFGMLGNSFAAFKGSENKKLMDDKELKKRFDGVANQFAVTEVLAFLVSLPVMFATEGAQFGRFCSLLMTDPKLQLGIAVSGMSFYLYNELATMTIKHTGPVTSSVANTAKRVIVMVYMAAITGKSLTDEQKIGATVAIGGVMVYSVIDDVVKKFTKPKAE